MRIAGLLFTIFGLGAFVSGAHAMGTMPVGALSAAARASTEAPIRLAEYYCSPGYEPTSGGRCIATASRDEVELYVDYPLGEPQPAPAPPHRRHRRHGLRERY